MTVRGITKEYDFSDDEWKTIATICARAITDSQEKLSAGLADLDKKLDEATRIVKKLRDELDF